MKLKILVALVGAIAIPAMVSALPFNDDMANTQAIRTGQMARAKPEGIVPVGGHQQTAATYQDALTLTNPNKKGDVAAIKNGKRLYSVNCTPCHGYPTDTGAEPSVAVKTQKMLMGGPDLGTDAYAVRPDGLFYATIHFGGMAIMPRVGYKLSPKETWDIVSYIRSLQETRKK